MSDRDLAPRTHALGREERERLNMDFGVGSAWKDGGSCRYCKNGVGGGNEEGESDEGLHGAGLDYAKGSDDKN